MKKVGYQITAFDASEEMVKFATQILKNPAVVMLFQDMNFCEEFDGVWASASLLHIPYNELKDIFRRVYQALKPNGIFFASFKRGHGEIIKDERTFYRVTEQSILSYISDGFQIIDIWATEDTRLTHSLDKPWLNVLLKKDFSSSSS